MASAAAQRIEALRRLRQQRALLDQYMGMVNAGDQIAAINSRTLGHESDWIPTARAIGDAKASDFQRNTRFPVFNWDDYMKDVRESLHLMRLNRKHWEAEQNDKIAAQTGLIPDPFNYQVDPKIPGVPDPFSYVPPEQKGMPVTDSPPLSSNEWREQYWMGSGERATDQGRVQIGPNTYWSSGMVANNPKEAKRLHYQYLDSPEANPELDAQTTITQMINSASVGQNSDAVQAATEAGVRAFQEYESSELKKNVGWFGIPHALGEHTVIREGGELRTQNQAQIRASVDHAREPRIDHMSAIARQAAASNADTWTKKGWDPMGLSYRTGRPEDRYYPDFGRSESFQIVPVQTVGGGPEKAFNPFIFPGPGGYAPGQPIGRAIRDVDSVGYDHKRYTEPGVVQLTPFNTTPPYPEPYVADGRETGTTWDRLRQLPSSQFDYLQEDLKWKAYPWMHTQAPVRNTDAVADYYETGGGAPTLGAPVAPVASFGDAMTDIAAMIAAAEPPPTPPARAFTTGMGMRPYRSFTAGPPTTVLATPGTKYLSTPISSPSIDTSAQVRNKKLEELLYGTA